MSEPFSERLEIIKEMYGNDEDIHQFDIEYLIEQAERVQELEKEFADDIDFKRREVHGLREENKRLREALLAIEDFDIELGDSRVDMQNKLSQIKFIKDKALEQSP